MFLFTDLTRVRRAERSLGLYENWWHCIRGTERAKSISLVSDSRPSTLDTTVATALVAERRCLSFPRSPGALYTRSLITQGVATWYVQIQRNRQFSYQKFLHCLSSVPHKTLPVLPAQTTWGPSADGQLPTQAPLQFVTQLSSALLLSAFLLGKMSNLLLVTWLLCEISRERGCSASGAAG